MGIAHAVLAGATLVLAGIAMYCARGLQQERLHMTQLAAVAATPAASVVSSATADATASADFAPPAAAQKATTGAVTYHPRQRRDAGDLAVARYHLARLDDPQGRIEEAAQLGEANRDWEQLAAYAGLSTEETRTLVALATEAQLRELRKHYACEADLACEPAYLMPGAIVSEELVQAFGPEKAERIRAHEAATEEHQLVRMLRELPATAELGNAEAGRLALALAEERQRLEAVAAEAGARVETEDGPYVGYHLRIATPPDEAHDLQRKLESARQYNARLYERAAAIVSPAPLARFKAMQDAALDSYRRKVEEMEVARMARRDLGLE